MVYLNALLIHPALGFVWLTLLFLLCFFAVHFIRLAKFGQQWRKSQSEKEESKPAQPTQEEKKTPPKESGEPIYYIVERKRRTKSSFGEPKRINFK